MERFLVLVAVVLAAVGVLQNATNRPTQAADPAPHYENLTRSCSTTNYVKPCHNRDSEDGYLVYMAECSVSVTTFCFTPTKSERSALLIDRLTNPATRASSTFLRC